MTPKKYRKTAIVEAVQYDGTNVEAICKWVDLLGGEITTSIPTLVIQTLEGPLEARPRDWIIKGSQGEVYPCKPDIFESTYEEIVEPLV